MYTNLVSTVEIKLKWYGESTDGYITDDFL